MSLQCVLQGTSVAGAEAVDPLSFTNRTPESIMWFEVPLLMNQLQWLVNQASTTLPIPPRIAAPALPFLALLLFCVCLVILCNIARVRRACCPVRARVHPAFTHVC